MSNYTKQECGIAEVMMCRYIEEKLNQTEPWLEDSIKDVVEDYGGELILTLISRGNTLKTIFDDIVGSSLFAFASAYLTYSEGNEEAVMDYLSGDDTLGKLSLDGTPYIVPTTIDKNLQWVWRMFLLVSGDEEVISRVNNDLLRLGLGINTSYLCENHFSKSVGVMGKFVEPYTDACTKHYNALAAQVTNEISSYENKTHLTKNATNYEDFVELHNRIRYNFFKLMAEYGFDFVLERTSIIDVRVIRGVAQFVFTEALETMASELDNIMLAVFEKEMNAEKK